ncbi:LysR family transcriptional regulator [Maritimibacter sp. DP1N21-5]|uniref:LysR family transcriptional regulator n=1 Tax=Maritimibacter sp. DP1N21-5 TaxID=2836867 RepID=UPI002106991B|nr:LysR family transcriptional regulator [Maritimibacter sp. DP1N21-5]
MDWKNVTFDWTRARAFLVTAEEGSLSAAARALGLTQPTLGRQVDLLEEELGVALFERVGRGLSLTPAGHALLPHARVMGEAAARLSMTAFGQNDAMEGPVVISSSDAYAGILLPPILDELTEVEPRITVEVVVSNSASDLLRREADIAIRSFEPKEPELIARRLRTADARLYASPDFVRRYGPFETPSDLTQARFIGLDNTGLMLGVLQQMGVPITEANIPIRCENFLVMWAMVLRGMGIGIIDDRIGDAEPGAVRVLAELPPLSFPVYLVAHREIHQNRRLRFVYDFLAERLR